jgi:transposase-like protein
MRNQKKYDKEFKLNAVKLYRESGKTQEEIAKDLGIPKSTLYSWIEGFKEHGESGFNGSGKLMPCNEEIYRLKKQLADVTMERDILKKAVTIFSKPKG